MKESIKIPGESIAPGMNKANRGWRQSDAIELIGIRGKTVAVKQKRIVMNRGGTLTNKKIR